MEENSNKNQETKKQEPSVKNKRKKAKIAVISLFAIVAVLTSMQVYASTNGYGNVFFMVKEWITGEKVTGEEEIFSDKDITLSYKSIELAEGLKIQVNRLEVKEQNSIIYISVKSEDGEPLPLVYDISVEGKIDRELLGYLPENTDMFEYTDKLNFNYVVKDDDIITIKIRDCDYKELKTLEINLKTREITVKGEKEFEKISQIELTKYLDIFSLLNDGSGYTESDNLIEIASKIQFIEGKGKAITTERETINEIVKQFYGENVKFETTKNEQDKDVEILKDLKVGVYEKESDSYDLMEHDRVGKCLKIEDVSYENGIYTVKFIYTLATGDEIEKATNADKLEELPQYETTIKLKRNENNKYSKYQIIDIAEGIEVKEKVSATVEEQVNTDKVAETTNETSSQNSKQEEALYKYVSGDNNAYNGIPEILYVYKMTDKEIDFKYHAQWNAEDIKGIATKTSSNLYTYVNGKYKIELLLNSFGENSIKVTEYENDAVIAWKNLWEDENKTIVIEETTNNEEKLEPDNYAEEVVKDEIKEKFLNSLKEGQENGTQEKLDDYRVDSVTILSDEEKNELVKQFPDEYEKNDYLGYVTYSVKPHNKDINNSTWSAGSGIIKGQWIENKSRCTVLREGKLIIGGTNW